MKNQRGFALIVAVFAITVFAMIGTTGMLMITKEQNAEISTLQKAQALYLCDSGVQYVLKQLEADTDWSDNDDISDEPFGGGTITVEFLNQTADSADLRITGQVGNVARKITIEYSRIAASHSFKHAIAAGGGVETAGAKVNGTIEENSPGSVPDVDFSYYESIADHVVNGNKDFSGPSVNGKWFVDGDVQIVGDVRITGTIVATGKIVVNSANKFVATAPEGLPCLVAGDSLEINSIGRMTINGVLHSETFIRVNSVEKFHIAGSMTAKEWVDFSAFGSGMITYVPRGPVNGFKGIESEGAGQVVYQNWRETS